MMELNEDKTEVSISKKDKSSRMLRFFLSLNQPLVDTYYCVLLTIEHICGKPIVLRLNKLVKELHASIKELYTEETLQYLHSCLMDIIRTSLRRFEDMGLITQRAFVDKKGKKNSFLSSPSEKMSEIVDTVKFL